MLFKINGYLYTVKINKFPSGEFGVVLPRPLPIGISELEIHYDWVEYTDRGLMVVAQLLEAISNHYLGKTYNKALVIPYFPYSRQDRVCNEGESFSLKVFASFVNSLGFDKVETWDNHSNVTTALINNCVNIPQENFVSQIDFLKENRVALVAPDLGAIKKTSDIAKRFGKNEIIRCDKNRDISTGQIKSIEVLDKELVKGYNNFFVADDICDGGGTFLALADAIQEIQPESYLYLYITHGFFTKGIEIILEKYKVIYTTASVCKVSHPNLTIIEGAK